LMALAPEPWSREDVRTAYHAALRLTTRNADTARNHVT